MEYHRYLKEVVDALESDPQFREKLEKAEETDIRVIFLKLHSYIIHFFISLLKFNFLVWKNST